MILPSLGPLLVFPKCDTTLCLLYRVQESVCRATDLRSAHTSALGTIVRSQAAERVRWFVCLRRPAYNRALTYAQSPFAWSYTTSLTDNLYGCPTRVGSCTVIVFSCSVEPLIHGLLCIPPMQVQMGCSLGVSSVRLPHLQDLEGQLLVQAHSHANVCLPLE